MQDKGRQTRKKQPECRSAAAAAAMDLLTTAGIHSVQFGYATVQYGSPIQLSVECHAQGGQVETSRDKSWQVFAARQIKAQSHFDSSAIFYIFV